MIKRLAYIIIALCFLGSMMPLHAQSEKEGQNDSNAESLQQEEKENLAISFASEAISNYKNGNYAEAVRLGTEALDICKEVMGKEHPVYAIVLNNLAGFNYALGNYSEAVRLGTEALDIREKAVGKEHPYYAQSLNNLASYNAALGNYAEAARLGTEALDIQEKVSGKEHPAYAQSLNNLASYNSSLGNYAEAVRLATEALNIYEKAYGREHRDYATSLNNLAGYNSALGNYDEAVRLAAEALDIREKVLGKEHPDYAQSLNNLASHNSALGNYAEAIRLSTEALNIREKVLGKEHPDYAQSLNNLAFYNFRYKQFDETSRLAAEAAQRRIMLICSTFSDLTANERNLFWQKYQQWFETDLPLYTFYIQTDSLAASAYNGVLMSKGLLLNSEMEMNRLLMESGDEEVVQLYNALRANRLMLDRLYGKPIAGRVMNTDSLEAVIGQQEKELVQRSKVYGDYTKNLSIDWKQVQEKLGDKDIAIEFLRFGVRNDSTMYAALTLTKEDIAPRMVPLFEKAELDGTDKDTYYSSTDLGNLVWKPLAEQLAGKENIYFAPAAELYNIAIESIPCFDGDGLMSDRWNLYRLSSTRELALIREKSEMRTGAVYGGLAYDMGKDALIEDSKRNGTRGGSSGTNSPTRTAIELLDRLPGTRAEAEAVSGMLQKMHVSTTLYMDSLGTESSFKTLSGKNTNVMHIATHGFYWPEAEASADSTDNRPKYVEDQALSRSGLYFAGANYTLAGYSLPEDVDDGILTASEISRLDLRGLELLVLSACQTGLGEITGDGVFGLQRGFKKAGAGTLLMTLWEVNDNATRMLMTRFYENLAAGKDKHTSLADAQRYVREYETKKTVTVGDGLTETRKVHPYEDPRYWAAFILLDGIE